MNRRDFSAALLGSGLTATTLSWSGEAAAQAPAPAEGQQFERIEPAAPTAGAGKIEVVEFFSYACPHCNTFEPVVQAWAKKLPADVFFHQVPVPFLMNAENFMRLHFALETLGQTGAMQRKVFTAVHVDHQYLEKPADIAALMAKNGLDATKFLDVFNSFSVATSVSRAKKLAAACKIDSVPKIVVQGRYATSPSQAGSGEQALAVTDFLIQRSRKAG